VERFVASCADAFGGVELLVANVGGASGGSLLGSTREDWERTLGLNVLHAVDAVRAAVPYMRRGGGSVLLVAPISGSKPAPKAQYGAAKAAEIYAAGALARELAPQRIRVNALSPGSILFEGGLGPAAREGARALRRLRAKRVPVGTPRKPGGGGGRRRLPALGARLVDKRCERARRRGPGQALDPVTHVGNGQQASLSWTHETRRWWSRQERRRTVDGAHRRGGPGKNREADQGRA